MKYKLSGILLFIAVSLSQAQTNYHFTSALAVSDCHRYGREAVVTDQLAWLISRGSLKPPQAEGKLITTESGEDLVWKKIEADSTGRFRGPALTNGYLYLTYNARRATHAFLNISGNSMVYANGEPRAGDIYSDGWMNLPVKLKKGLNEFFVRCGNFSRWQGVKASLSFPAKEIQLHTEDLTLPHIVIGNENDILSGGIVISSHSDKGLSGFSISATLNGKTTETPIGHLPAGTLRKTRFDFHAADIDTPGDYACRLQLKQNGKVVDEKMVNITAVRADQHQSYTFTSAIDGSIQYYGVAPQKEKRDERPALFLSVHGAGVEAIGQARAYQSKNWGVLVAPTNRRPRGFNWEDWGRIDALEVLELAKERFKPDPEKIYLTGHSMGGHGTWYLGATYPDKWAAIAPCAGYPTLTAYGSADGRIPDSARTATEKILLRASNGSNVIDLAANYKDLGVYIFHGDDDRVVPVRYARQMREVLGTFHPDFSYKEYPGGSHWFGNESVDWPPLFEFFRHHRLSADSATDAIEFITAHPGISSSHRWAAVIQQEQPLAYSKFSLKRDKKEHTIAGTTENIALLRLNLDVFNPGDSISVTLDSNELWTVVPEEREVYLSRHDEWKLSSKPGATQKNEKRSGTFKEAFNHRMVFVYGTGGNAKENAWAYNKARYDAETWYYRGNGAVEIIPDHAFTATKYQDRGVILYGNADTNTAWTALLRDSPVQVTRDAIRLGDETFRGDDLGAYFTWPRPDSEIASVAVVTGTGIAGLRATDPNQYFAAGSGFPDYVIFSSEMLRTGARGIKAAGFFDHQWRVPTYTSRE